MLFQAWWCVLGGRGESFDHFLLISDCIVFYLDCSRVCLEFLALTLAQSLPRRRTFRRVDGARDDELLNCCHYFFLVRNRVVSLRAHFRRHLHDLESTRAVRLRIHKRDLTRYDSSLLSGDLFTSLLLTRLAELLLRNQHLLTAVDLVADLVFAEKGGSGCRHCDLLLDLQVECGCRPRCGTGRP